jgi:integrase
MLETLPPLTTPRPFPEVYRPEEVERILSVPGLRIEHRTMLMTLYAAGLRADEIARLKVTDIQSWRMRIRVQQEESENERYTVLSPELLKILRNYWRIFRPGVWLFTSSRDSSKPVHPVCLCRTFNRAIEIAGLPSRGGVHALRHSFAVHMLESGTDLQTLQRFLGHRWIIPTTIYIHLMRQGLSEIKNPLGLLHANQAADGSEAAL